jgi:putative SOS response-associated peptidase YedK
VIWAHWDGPLVGEAFSVMSSLDGRADAAFRATILPPPIRIPINEFDEALVYSFLTTSPNAIVEPIHDKAMRVILTTEAAAT